MTSAHHYCPRIVHFYLIQFLLLQEEVNRTQISGNLDAPEGGFDAIMQAIACQVSVCSIVNNSLGY